MELTDQEEAKALVSKSMGALNLNQALEIITARRAKAAAEAPPPAEEPAKPDATETDGKPAKKTK